jgi:quercetin dioxygenase-like cupin family protein
VTSSQTSGATNEWSNATTKQIAPNTVVHDHSHPFNVRAIVTAGDITLTVHGEARTYRLGDVLTMAGGCVHHEQIGLDGVEYRVVRTDPATET